LAPLDGVLNVWLGPSGDIGAARPVTREKRRPVRWFRFAQNSAYLLYAQDKGGDENYQLYAVELATGQTRDLTERPGARAFFVADSPKRPNEILIGLNDRDPKWHDVWRIDVTTGHKTLVETNAGVEEYFADMNLDLRAAIKPASGGSEILRKDGRTWRSVLKIADGDAMTTYPLGVAGGGKDLLMLDSRGRDKAALVSVDLATGAAKVLGENPKADAVYKISDPATAAPLAFSAAFLRNEWSAIDPSVKTDLDVIRKAVPGIWNPLSQSADNRFWTLRIDNVAEPVKFALYDRSVKKLTTLFYARPSLVGTPLARMHPLVIKSRDGLDLVSYLTLPGNADADGDGRPEKPLAMVLNVHGGPWTRNEFGYDPEHQWMANRGYAVLSVNFRGSTGFGKVFVNAADHEWAGKMHDDLLDAVDWAVKQRIAQRDKIAIYGGSYGGYAALVGLTFTPKTFACGVSIVGPSNLNTMLASVPPYWASFFDKLTRRVGDPATPEGKKLLTDRSPLFRAAEIERPLLIAQGANDPRVKQAESDQIVAAMRKRKIPVAYVLYADEGHGFARPENRMSFYAVAEAFLGKCLGGKVQPIGGDFAGASIAALAGKEFIPGLSEALGMVNPK
jgi:dipeptidyl aminopeptidase/acylaminoacyl peptidase